MGQRGKPKKGNKNVKKKNSVRVVTATLQRCTVNGSAAFPRQQVAAQLSAAQLAAASGSISLSSKKTNSISTTSSNSFHFYLYFSIVGPNTLVPAAAAAAAAAVLGLRVPPRRRALLRARPMPRHIDRGRASPPPLLLLLPQRGRITRAVIMLSRERVRVVHSGTTHPDT